MPTRTGRRVEIAPSGFEHWPNWLVAWSNMCLGQVTSLSESLSPLKKGKRIYVSGQHDSGRGLHKTDYK